MQAPAGRPAQWGWQEFFKFSERIIQDAVLERQCSFIHSILKEQIQADAKLWLSEIFSPLPGESIPSCVDYGKPNHLVAKAIQNNQIEMARKSGGLSAAVPLFAHGRLVGAFKLEFTPGKTLRPSELTFLKGMAAYCGSALYLSRQDAVRDWRLQQLTLLREVNLQIARQRQDSTVFQIIMDLIQKSFDFYFVLLYTFSEDDNKLHYQASTARKGAHPSLDKTGLDDVIPLGKGLVGLAARNKKEVISRNVNRDSRYRSAPGLPDTSSEACLPLVIEGRLYGILDVQSDHLNEFHQMDLVVLRILADNVAAAVEGVQMVEVLNTRSRQLEAVTEVSRILASILDLDELLHQVVSIVRDKFNYPFVHCFVLDPVRQSLVFAAGTGAISRSMAEKGFSFGLNDQKGLVSWSAREGKTYQANDVSREPLYLENALPPAHTRAEMTVPLKYGEEVLGVLDLQSDQLQAFGEEDRFILEALAASISTALHNANLYRTEKWRRAVAESYKTIAELFSTQFTLEVVYQAILKELMRNLPSDAAAIFLLEAGERKRSKVPLKLASVEGVGSEKVTAEMLKGGRTLEWLMRVVQSEQPQIRLSGNFPEPLGKALRCPRDYSAIAAPLWTTDQALGVIVLAHPDANRYGEEAASMLATFAGYISIALQNNQLYISSVEQAWISTVMLQVTEAAQSAETAEGLLQSIARITPLLIGVDRCAFYLHDKYSNTYKLTAHEGFKEDQLGWLIGLMDSEQGAKDFEKIRKTHQPIKIFAANLSATAPGASLNRGQYLIMPLYSRNEMLGAYLVENRITKDNSASLMSQNDQHMHVFQGIARQTAVALENLQLKESNQSEGYITAVLLQVAQTLVSSTSFQETSQSIATILPYLVGLETVLIYQLDPEKQVFHLRGAYSERWDDEMEEMDHRVKPGENRILDFLANEKKPVFIKHGGTAPNLWDNAFNAENISKNTNSLGEDPHALFGLPLMVRNECFGALLVAENSTNFAFREKRFEIIRDVAQQLAMAAQSDRLTHEMLDNERMKHEMQLANEIQRTFLPDQMPVIPGWEVDVHWHPARQVSGDFYDAFQLPDGRFGFVIADVSDKGIPAALYMTVTRTLVHASAMDGESPAQTLYQVNKLLMENSQEGLFTTVFYVLVNPQTGELTYCNAGHNRPAWLHSAEKKLTWLEKGGTALGSFAEINLCDTTIEFDRGDGLLMYTDGVTEARGPYDHLYGLNRLKKFLTGNIHNLVKDLLTDLDADLASFRQNQPQSDDITLMALRRL
jgi:sigma-B regulation protein RsbU (phosphoserine phosphatase)